MRRGIVLALGIGISLAALPAMPGSVHAEPVTATALVLNGRVFGGPGDTLAATGNAGSITSTWRRAGDSYDTWVSVTGPTSTGLGVGPWSVAGSADATHGNLAVGFSTCWGGHVDVLEAPIFDGVTVLTFAADWTGCGGSGAIRIGSSVPLAALRADQEWLLFGVRDMGSVTEMPLGYRNVGNVPVDVGPATVGPNENYPGYADFSVRGSDCTGSLAPGATCSVGVAFLPTSWENLYATITLATSPAAAGAFSTTNGSGHFVDAANDAIADAADITSLPYVYYANAATATTDRLDPVCDGGYQQTVWFHYRAAVTEPVAISTADSDSADTVVGVYEGTPPDDLSPVVCQDDWGGSLTSLARFPAHAGHDYWIIVAKGQAGSLGTLIVRAFAAEPDTSVEVSGWAASSTIFYPYPDGIRDTTNTVATLAEPADVTIDVVAASAPSVVLRHVVLGRREAQYGWRWDGKNGAGTTVAAGNYLVRHQYRDVFGNTSSHDIPITVSAKRLYYATTTAVISGYRPYIRYASGSGAYTAPSGTSLVLKSGKGVARAAYRFTLTSAAVVVTNIRFEIVGKSTTGKKATIETWNTQMGAWDWSRSIGPGYGTWKGPTVPAAGHVYGRYAYGQIEVRYNGSVNWIVNQARLTYTYGYLK